MKVLKWNAEKEQKILDDTTRQGITFSDCAIAIHEQRILDILPHPTRPNQRLLVLNIDDYAYVVPFIEEDDGSWFLKTVYPSRTHNAIYLLNKKP